MPDEHNAPYHRIRRDPHDPTRMSGAEWLADRDPDRFRKGPRRAINTTALSRESGIAKTTLHRVLNGIQEPTEPVISGLKAFAMRYDVDEATAQREIFEFVVPDADEAPTLAAA
jgi:hypothetical protein